MKKIVLVGICLFMITSSLFAVIPVIPIIISASAAAASTAAVGTTATTALVENNVIESDDLNFLGGIAISHVPETHILAGTIGQPAQETNRTFCVGEPFDLYLQIRVVNRHWYNRSKPITGTITIPHTEIAYYEAVGENSIQITDKKEDPVNRTTTYTFSVMSGDSNKTKPSTIRFRCTPLEVVSDYIHIVYDQNVKSQYDVRDTFHFYERENI